MENQPATPERDRYHHGDLRRSLIEAALALLNEEQNWNFSLREVSRRAGVSHNAPYNHFGDKRDLLAAVAEAGFLSLRDRMRRAVAGVEEVDKALIKSGIAYVKFGVENPGHYRLMFGSTLVTAEGLPEFVMQAADSAKAVLVEIIMRGATQRVFTPSPARKEEIQMATLACWAAVHGLTLLAVDRRMGPIRLKPESVAERVASTVTFGLMRR